MSKFFLIVGAIMTACLTLVAFAPPHRAQALTVNPRLELEADPGTTLRTELQIQNEERQSRTFYLRTENFNAQDETGTPHFLNRKEGLATWVEMPLSITLGPGQSVNFSFAIHVPADAQPGGHYAAIFFSTEPPNPGGSADTVAIGSKLGTLILLRVKGEFLSAANILEFGTSGKKKFFSNLPIQLFYRFQNVGEDHLKPVGDITISNLLGQTVKVLPANTIEGSVLPKSVRRFTSVWSSRQGGIQQQAVVDLPKREAMPYWEAVTFQARNFAFGRYTATLELVFGSSGLQSDHAKFTFYIIPWQLLSVIAPSMLFGLLLLRLFIKRYNRYIINRARNQL